MANKPILPPKPEPGERAIPAPQAAQAASIPQAPRAASGTHADPDAQASREPQTAPSAGPDRAVPQEAIRTPEDRGNALAGAPATGLAPLASPLAAALAIPALPSLARLDNPWRRLPYTLGAALVFWLLLLAAFTGLLQPPPPSPEPLAPVDAQLIEEPPPPPPRQAKATPAPAPKVEPKGAPQPAPAAPRPAPTPPVHSVPAPLPKAAPSPNALPSPPAKAAPAPAPAEAKDSHADAQASSGARAVTKPMPTIPDDLRDEAFSASALARFHVGTDGSVSVELVKPTQNPRLNRLLLDSLKKWRFFPAMKNGKPVATTEELVVHFQVQ